MLILSLPPTIRTPYKGFWGAKWLRSVPYKGGGILGLPPHLVLHMVSMTFEKKPIVLNDLRGKNNNKISRKRFESHHLVFARYSKSPQFPPPPGSNIYCNLFWMNEFFGEKTWEKGGKGTSKLLSQKMVGPQEYFFAQTFFSWVFYFHCCARVGTGRTLRCFTIVQLLTISSPIILVLLLFFCFWLNEKITKDLTFAIKRNKQGFFWQNPKFFPTTGITAVQLWFSVLV